jgi:hypothetical protein
LLHSASAMMCIVGDCQIGWAELLSADRRYSKRTLKPRYPDQK